MRKEMLTIPADTPGVTWQVPVLRFAPRAGGAGPSVYLQAALHANEQPGTSVLHVLCAHLRRAEHEGRLSGEVTAVPAANPIGLSQYFFGDQMGRFDAVSRGNFNRDYPLLERPDPSLLDEGGPHAGAEALKRRLLGLAMPHDIVLDLHCDDESVPYVYVHHALWPAARDLAAALGAQAAILWDGPDGGGAFEEAALAPWLALSPEEARLERRVVSTVELRGRADVSQELAERDAEGLLAFLEGRGVVEGPRRVSPPSFNGPARSIRQVSLMPAPVSGVLWYHRAPGDRVRAGDRLVTILEAPGEADGVVVTAPHDGLVLTRRAHRFTRLGEDLLKLVGDETSRDYTPGPLESR